MKKKLKDITVGEIYRTCHQNNVDCEDCPFAVLSRECKIYWLNPRLLKDEYEVKEKN